MPLSLTAFQHHNKEDTMIISCDTTPKVEDGYINIGKSSLYYKTIGKGEPLIVLHGGPGFDHQGLMPYIGNLGKYCKVVLYDQRGSGMSTGPVDAASINVDRFVEDIEIIRKQLGVEKINLSGISWGGMLALFYGVKYPDKLNSLVLFSTAASAEMFLKFFPALKKKRTKEDSELIEGIKNSDGFKDNEPKVLEEFFSIFCKAYFADQSLASKIDVTINENTAKNHWAIDNFIMASIGNFDLHNQLNVIDCPTLIMHGRQDPMPLEAAVQINENIPNSELVVFENSGHFIFIEEEEKFNSTVSDFLSKIKY